MYSGPSNVPRTLWTRLYFLYLTLVLLVVTPLCAAAYAVECLFGGRASGFGRWSNIWSRALLGLGLIRLDVEGQLEVTDKPCVYMANHQNSLDIPAMAIAINRPFGYVAKASLARVPFLGWALRLSPSVFVDTSNPKVSIASLKKAAKVIGAGSSVAIFPEGQRTWSDGMLPFKKRGFMLAKEAGVPIVPVAIVGAHQLFDERTYVARPGTMSVVIGDPFMPEQISAMSLSDLMAGIQSRISAMSVGHLHGDDKAEVT